MLPRKLTWSNTEQTLSHLWPALCLLHVNIQGNMEQSSVL